MDNLLSAFLDSPFMGISLSLGTFCAGLWIQKKGKSPLLNPLLISIVLVIAVLLAFSIPMDSYEKGGNFLSLFLTPATAALAYSIYQQWELLKKNWIPVLAGCTAGVLTSMGSVFLFSKVLGLNEILTASMLPKSVTTPIAMEISAQMGGIPPVTVAAVVCTGIFGAILSPVFIRLLQLRNPVAIGVAIGSSSHALGTTKALEIGTVEGAMSGLSIGVSGILTVMVSLFL